MKPKEQKMCSSSFLSVPKLPNNNLRSEGGDSEGEKTLKASDMDGGGLKVDGVWGRDTGGRVIMTKDGVTRIP